MSHQETAASKLDSWHGHDNPGILAQMVCGLAADSNSVH